MSLADARYLVRDAWKRGYGIPAYDTVNMDIMQWVVEVAEEKNSPVFLMYLEGFKESISIQDFAKAARIVAEGATVPVVIHLDHSRNIELIKEAIDAGFTSVMYDGSSLPYEENLKNTKEAAEYAHAHNIPIEAELGHVGVGMNREDFVSDAMYTDPEQAKNFVKETGIDYLAVAIGNSHGVYIETPHLDIPRLEKLNAAAGVPLVLHGTSLIPEDQVSDAVRHGICKVNIATEFYISMIKAVKEIATQDIQPADGFMLLHDRIRPECQKYLREKFDLLQNAGK